MGVSEIKKRLACRIYRKSKMSCGGLCRLKRTAPPYGDTLKILCEQVDLHIPKVKHVLISWSGYFIKGPNIKVRNLKLHSGGIHVSVVLWCGLGRLSSSSLLWRWTFCSFLTFKVWFSLHFFSFQKQNTAKEKPGSSFHWSLNSRDWSKFWLEEVLAGPLCFCSMQTS